jgi:hypothetical protein
MPAAWRAGLFFGAVLILASAGRPAEPAESRPGEATPRADASRLDVLSAIEKSDYRRKWRHFPGTRAFHNGQQPHGMLITTYVNDAALAGLLRKADAMPDGSMLIAENYMPDKTLGSIMVMYKREGYNVRGGDWYWVEQLADSTVASAGKTNSCIACHRQGDRDYIMTPVR